MANNFIKNTASLSDSGFHVHFFSPASRQYGTSLVMYQKQALGDLLTVNIFRSGRDFTVEDNEITLRRDGAHVLDFYTPNSAHSDAALLKQLTAVCRSLAGSAYLRKLIANGDLDAVRDYLAEDGLMLDNSEVSLKVLYETIWAV